MAVSRDGAKRARTADLLGAIQVCRTCGCIHNRVKTACSGDFDARFQAYLDQGTDLFCSRGRGLDILVRSKVRREGECWLWTGSIDNHGYGHLSRGRQSLSAHRASYEAHVGDIGALVLDHLCCNRACVNPAHLEPVTQAENVRRRDERRRGVAPYPDPQEAT